MNHNCILCGKNIERGAEYTGHVAEALLHPVCLECWTLCDKEPQKVINQYCELIDKVLADDQQHWKAHRFDRKKEVETTEQPSLDTILKDRYKHVYELAKVTSDCAKFVKGMGIVFAAVIITGGTLALPRIEIARNPLMVLGGFTAAAMVALMFYWGGTLLQGLGQLLAIAADTAVNTSPLLSNEVKAKELEVPYVRERKPTEVA